MEAFSVKPTPKKPPAAPRNAMRRYSAFAIAREALRHHTGWQRAWRSPAPKAHYKVIVIGAGGHGLATAYYLRNNFV